AVDPSERVDGGLHDRRAPGHGRHRVGVRDGTASRALDLLDHSVGDFARRLVSVHRDAVVVHDDRRAFRRGRERHRAADSAAAARDRDHLAVECTHVASEHSGSSRTAKLQGLCAPGRLGATTPRRSRATPPWRICQAGLNTPCALAAPFPSGGSWVQCMAPRKPRYAPVPLVTGASNSAPRVSSSVRSTTPMLSMLPSRRTRLPSHCNLSLGLPVATTVQVYALKPML